MSTINMRNLGLDILRCLAVILVLGRHALVSKDNLFMQIWNRGGWAGVDLFFVLSGFLVSGLLFREHMRTGKITCVRFLVRRGLKIYPAFWVLLLFTLLIYDKPIPARGLMGELFFLQNYLGGLWNHTWSLAVEEHFYLLLVGFFYLLIAKTGNFNSFPIHFLVIASLCLLLRVSNLFLFPAYSHKWFLFATHIRIDSLCFGVLLSYFFHYQSLQSRLARIPSWLLILAGMVLFSPVFIFTLEETMLVSIIGVILLYIGSGCLVVAAIRLESSNLPILRLLGACGAASYSIYLWHVPVNIFGTDMAQKLFGNISYGTYLFVYMGGTFLVGYLMSKMVEWPVLKARDRFFPSRSGTHTASSSYSEYDSSASGPCSP